MQNSDRGDAGRNRESASQPRQPGLLDRLNHLMGARRMRTTNDRLFIIAWLVACISVLVVASLAAV